MGLGCTEPDAGSDLTSVSTTAAKENGEYVINGSKIFITNGTIADYLVVFCVTNPDVENPFARHSLIMVETDRKGFEANKLMGKMGARATITSELSFNDVRVPESNLVGEVEGKGFLSDYGYVQQDAGRSGRPGNRSGPKAHLKWQ